MDSSRISPTAHYTATAWERNGLAHPALRGQANPALFRLAQPMVWAGRRLSGGLTIEGLLLQRHRILDELLARQIEGRGVRQVVEIAAGLSSRGLRFAEARPEVTYVEADLPGMIARKRAALAAAGVDLPNHRLVEIDALRDGGPGSLDELAAQLDPRLPTALITEGLLPYFDLPTVLAMWGRFGRFLDRFPRGVYLADLYLAESARELPVIQAFLWVLSAVARGRVRAHFDHDAAAEAALAGQGFRRARIYTAGEWTGILDIPLEKRGRILRVIEARRERAGEATTRTPG